MPHGLAIKDAMSALPRLGKWNGVGGVIPLMEDILHLLIGSLQYPVIYKVYTSQLVQDFLYQEYVK